MAHRRYLLLALATSPLRVAANGGYVWPNDQTDQLENILYEQSGFLSSSALFTVEGCTGIGTGGRIIGAEWLRNAYHDMATADVFKGTGGIDASIAFETERPENVGKAFNGTIDVFTGLLTTRSSMADMIALAAVTAVGACSNGTMIIPLRAGRVDATGPGPSGVPQPQDSLVSHTESFARQGFSPAEMISLVACGHTIGGVHGVDFPDIVPITDPNPVDDNVVDFDTTGANFDNRVAVEFAGNATQNPLVIGNNVTTRSDFRIFNSDGGKLMSRFAASNSLFVSTCTTLLERMINTVPKNVVLSDIIEPVLVKPRALAIAVNPNGTMTISGTVRIAASLVPESSQILFQLSPRAGSVWSQTHPHGATATGTTDSSMVTTCIYPNCGPDFIFYNFETYVPVGHGVSSFTVEILNTATGRSVIYDNGGSGFPLSDTIQPQLTLSTRYTIFENGSSSNQYNLTVAVLNAAQFSKISFVVPESHPPDSPVPSFVPTTIPMRQSQKVPGSDYTLYSGTYFIPEGQPSNTHPYDIVATGPGKTVTNTFNSWLKIPEKIIFNS